MNYLEENKNDNVRN